MRKWLARVLYRAALRLDCTVTPFGGLFGGGGRKRGLRPSEPIVVKDVELTEKMTQFLNLALPMLSKGSVDRAIGQLPTFKAGPK
jgi:hypothetical protein